ncbi:pro-Pol polyprotein [Trichonephila clavipes]|nr:pro-Pol polyprotein [Trichonephila clavipes]
MFGDNFAKELQSIPLSNDTVSRRIDDIAEDVEQQLSDNLIASYEWVRDPFQNTPEGFWDTTEEESFIDFTSSGEIKRQFLDAFTKFTWLYPIKTVSAESALEKLKQQQKTFGNPIRIISDRGSAFTSKLFNDYCDEENIQHLQIATGVPRGNGQVERIHRTLIPVLTKLSLDDSTKWYKIRRQITENTK